MSVSRVLTWGGRLVLRDAPRLARPRRPCVRAHRDPLAQLGHADLPGLPHYRRHGLSGDATGFYAGAREFIAAWGRVPGRCSRCSRSPFWSTASAVRAWRRRPDLRAWLVPLSVFAFGLVVTVDVLEQDPSGAAVFGWPLVWALPLLPIRVLGSLDQGIAFDVGLVLQLACNVVTLVATAYAGFYASGRRAVGVAAAALWAFWPFLSGLIAGHSAWENGSWAIDAGLHMYTEPLSTALVAVALALVLAPDPSGMRLALAGCALSLATFVKDSNALVAGLASSCSRGGSATTCAACCRTWRAPSASSCRSRRTGGSATRSCTTTRSRGPSTRSRSGTSAAAGATRSSSTRERC